MSKFGTPEGPAEISRGLPVPYYFNNILGEVYYSACKYSGTTEVGKFLTDLESNFNLKIINPDYLDCLEAAKYKASCGIAYFDCFNLVLAKKYPKATILTLDTEYKKFAKEFKIEIL